MPEPLPVAAEPRPAAPGHAGHWGLGALVFGLVVILSFPHLLGFALRETREAFADPTVGPADLQLAITGGLITAYSMLSLAGLGLLFGLIGIVSGWQHGQPLGQAVAGTVLCIPALALAVVLQLALQRVGDDLQKLKKHRESQNHRSSAVESPLRPGCCVGLGE